MTSQPLSQTSSSFETIKRVTESSDESWSARELARVLEYSDFRHFLPPIEKAKEACAQSRHKVEDHFEQILDMVEIGSGARHSGIPDFALSVEIGTTWLTQLDVANLFCIS